MRRHSRLKIIINLCSLLVLVYSFTMLPPLLIAAINQEKNLFAFLMTFCVFFCSGFLGWRATGGVDKAPETRDGFIIIVVFWLLFSVISALPFLLSEELAFSAADALFEGVSGITTTGASVALDISHLPYSFLYYRAQLNFIGGLGVIILAVALFPLLGIGGMKLYQSEMPGPFKEERLTPRLADTAKNLWMIYLILGVLCIFSYKLAGMPWFDALCHGLSTVSLGGFSTHNESVGFYNSAWVDLVAGLFSLLSAVSFSLYFAALYRRSLRPVLQSQELRFFILMTAIMIGVVWLIVYCAGMYGFTKSFVQAFFLTSSMITDNGLAPSDYANWPIPAIVLLMFASYLGGCTGSTSGGMKSLRVMLLFRQTRHEIWYMSHPRAVMNVKLGNSVVSDRVMRSVWSFFFLYIACTVIFIWLLTLLGYDVLTSFATVSACINNMGLGFGETVMTFGHLSDTAKYLMCLAMVMGRLEIYPVLILLSRTFWRG